MLFNGQRQVDRLLLIALAATSGAAWAQNYPVKPVRVVIPWPAGGSNDIAGRLILQKLPGIFGQQFVVDNRPGAAGSIGADVVAKAAPDGHTLMIHSTTHVGNATLYKNLPYDVIKDFTGIAFLAAQPSVLVAHPSLPVKNVKELIALAKRQPGQILYSSSGNGSAPHLNMTLFTSMTGTKMVHVPYKGGAPSVTALVGGEAQVMIATIATVVTQINAGRLRPLGVASSQRMKNWPDWPTIAESGVPGYEMNAWIGLFGPAGLPSSIVERLNTEIGKVQQMPDVEQALSRQGLAPWIASAEAFSKRLLADREKYAKLITMTGATVD